MVDWDLMPDCLKSEMVQVPYTDASGNELVRLENTVEITGLDRSNPNGTASEWLDTLISKKYCSIAEAYDIINLPLVGIINETTGEEAVVYLFASTKLNGTIAECMNLPADILGIIPYDSQRLANSPIVELPEPSYGWFGELVAYAWESQVGAFIALFGAKIRRSYSSIFKRYS